jgi:putative colanic acid biosynthesis glycosyltransferase
MNEIKNPIISVVTVVYEAKNILEETILSVINQSDQHFEYIIIDGGSSDGTIDIIKKYNDYLACWLSESDRGIYDAMNKGINISKGEWIIFLNAGDRFFGSQTLEDLRNDLVLGVDVVYGDVDIIYDTYRVTKRAGELSKIWQGMQFCHQSSIVRRKCLIDHAFGLDNPIAADLEWFIRAVDDGYIFRYHTKIISSVSAGGISDINQYRAVSAVEKAVRNIRNDWWLAPYFFMIMSFVCFKSIIKILIPDTLLRYVRKMKSSR